MSKSQPRIMIAAGGSGGHIFPAIALARRLQKMKSGIDVIFVGSCKAIDRRIFEKDRFKFFLLSANKLAYKVSPAMVVMAVKFLYDLIKSFILVCVHRPDVIVGFGGYVSFPVMLNGHVLGIPTIAHEQNVVPGRANRALFKFSDSIAVTFEETKDMLGQKAKKTIFTGNPIRTDDFNGDRTAGIQKLGLEASKFTVLVIGGSQGAHFLNSTFIEAIDSLDAGMRSALQVVHITGVKDYEWALQAYDEIGIEHRVYSFLDCIEDAYNASDLVVTRSGASAIFELAFFARPMILVPYPFAMSHQAENARAFSKKGAAIMIEERELTPGILRDHISRLYNNRVELNNIAEAAKAMSVPDASERLAIQVLGMVR